MPKQTTRVLLEVRWDPDENDHPANWDYSFLLEGDPFSSEGTRDVRMLSFEDVNEKNQPEQL